MAINIRPRCHLAPSEADGTFAILLTKRYGRSLSFQRALHQPKSGRILTVEKSQTKSLENNEQYPQWHLAIISATINEKIICRGTKHFQKHTILTEILITDLRDCSRLKNLWWTYLTIAVINLANQLDSRGWFLLFGIWRMSCALQDESIIRAHRWWISNQDGMEDDQVFLYFFCIFFFFYKIANCIRSFILHVRLWYKRFYQVRDTVCIFIAPLICTSYSLLITIFVISLFE